MKCIEENSERLNLMEKTLLLEQKQKKRMIDLTKQEEKDIETATRRRLYDGYSSNVNSSILDQEEAQRKELVKEMVETSTPLIEPAVRVLQNVQGKFGVVNFTQFKFLF